MGDQPDASPLPTHRTTQHTKSPTHTSMPRVRFKPTIPVFDWPKTVRASDRSAIGTGAVKLFLLISLDVVLFHNIPRGLFFLQFFP